VRAVAEELGVSGHTLSYWKAQAMGLPQAKLRAVRVIEKTSRGHALIGPSGTRVDDLSLDEIADLFRKLS
jgi:hypothetical protein